MKRITAFIQTNWLIIIICFLTSVGVFFKFYHLEDRFFWYDEIYTIEHTKGNQHFNIAVDEIKTKSYYLDQLSLNNQNASFNFRINGLISSPNPIPLHYSLLMVWCKIIGDSPFHYRLFSLFIFIISLPFLFLLVKKITGSRLAGLIALCLYCSSPYFNYFAQQARYYMLWTFLIILLHYVLFNALSSNKTKWWILYIIVGILSLYANMLSGLVLIGHFIYILICKKSLLKEYCISSLFILLFYTPWIILMINYQSEINNTVAWHNWTGYNLNFITLILAQIILMAESFISFHGSYGQLDLNMYLDFKTNYLLIFNSLFVITIIIYSVYYILSTQSKEKSAFLLLIIIPQILFFIVVDLVRNTGATYTHRYHVINIIGILLFLSLLFYKKLKQSNLTFIGIFLLMVLLGLNSIYDNSRNRCWYTAPYCKTIVARSDLLKSNKNTLIISDYKTYEESKFIDFISMVNEYKNYNVDYLIATTQINNLEKLLASKSYSKIYVFNASGELIDRLSNFSIKMEMIHPGVWVINLNKT
jgi:uncharacterized membrane protein